MNIVIVGHVCIDKNTSENSAYGAAGSPAMFMHTIFSQFPDCHVIIISPYGDDFKKYIKNINLYPKNPSDKETLIYENITKNGKRHQKAYNRNATLIELDSHVENLLKDADIVVFAPILPNFSSEYIQHFISHTRKNVPVFLLPQGYYRDFNSDNSVTAREFKEEKEILPFCDFIFVSKEDYPDMVSIAGKWAQDYQVTSIVTLGGEGAIAFMNETELPLPTIVVPESQVIDSVGCGDIFAAAFSYRYAQTKDIKEAGRFANVVARQSLFYKADDIKINYLEAL